MKERLVLSGLTILGWILIVLGLGVSFWFLVPYMIIGLVGVKAVNYGEFQPYWDAWDFVGCAMIWAPALTLVTIVSCKHWREPITLYQLIRLEF